MSVPVDGAPFPERGGVRSGIVTLTTDFGSRSSYVGSLRGALLSVSADLVLADLSHDISHFEIMEAALILRAAAPAYPPGTVHLAVVDPGVGGARRPIVVESGGYFFVGPDNGVFTPFLSEGASLTVLDPDRVSRGVVSPTFHGRDLFAPAAAEIALGAAPGTLGNAGSDPVHLHWPVPRATPLGLEAVVLHVDPFGNVITNVPESLLPEHRHDLRVRLGGVSTAAWTRTYAEVPAGTLVALVGSGGLVEVAVNRGSAAERLGVREGDVVSVIFGEDGL
jgi:S-adenosyl-L-methionine hydrolase (adenosine-forming)